MQISVASPYGVPGTAVPCVNEIQSPLLGLMRPGVPVTAAASTILLVLLIAVPLTVVPALTILLDAVPEFGRALPVVNAAAILLLVTASVAMLTSAIEAAAIWVLVIE
jgi:hypothetical protein